MPQRKSPGTQLRLLNLGCGARFHPEWTNVDLAPSDPSVVRHDLLAPLPFADNTFDGVYHSHVLEHLPRDRAVPFLRECRRVLRPGATLRVAVPDLEELARLYLESVRRSRDGERDWQHNHDWLMLELYDQVVRTRSGGDMERYLRDPRIPNPSFVTARLGAEAEHLMHPATTRAAEPPRSASLLRRLQRVARRPRRLALRLLLGDDLELLETARFRGSGEVHQWMYDAHSLGTALEKAGLVHPRRVGASESSIEGWASFMLDADSEGQAHKPDSLYMEVEAP